MAATQQIVQDRVFDQLADLQTESSRIDFIVNLGLLSPSVVKQLDDAVAALIRVDLKKANKLAEAAVTIADTLGDTESQAHALRAKANALWFLGDNRQASELHARAVALFERAGSAIEAARTLSSSIQPLILLGEYARAHAAADKARAIFSAAGETARLARLEINVGNIFHRQDRFQEALACYKNAYSELLLVKDLEGIFCALHNIAACLTMLDEFAEAMSVYEHVRNFCLVHDMPLELARTDYHIAYLYYVRGQYGRAIEMLRPLHEAARSAGDQRRAALCLLDLSQIYLELNFNQEAGDLAQEAFTAFERLGMGYDAAKALCQYGVALSQQGKPFRSLMPFAQSQKMFLQEKNQVWAAVVDFYQALVHYSEGRFEESRLSCLVALNFFVDSPLTGRAILCRLLLARLALKAGEVAAARRQCQAALAQLGGQPTPILVYQAQLVMGQIEEAVGNLEEAAVCYRASREVLEKLRSGLHGEELKISFLENKVEVYESLVSLYLAREPRRNDKEEAWACMESAKSRCLMELIVSGVKPKPSDQTVATGTALRIATLREQLNWHYHRLEVEELAQVPASNGRLSDLRQRATENEKELLRLSRELPSEDTRVQDLAMAAPISLKRVQEAVGAEATLIEYFRTREKILAAVISEKDLDIVEVTGAPRIAESLHMLRYQFEKFRLGPSYVEKFQQSLLEATQARLHELYQQLFKPLQDKVRGKHLVVVPHESLHCVPFHALFDGDRYIADSFSVSYAPSAGIYVHCRNKRANHEGPSLVLGVPDPHAPHISEELQSVAALVPQARLLVGADASDVALREHGPNSRLIHIATHGFFRGDSPMFSGIRLGNTFLTPYDLYQLALPADQITLSCCSTGMNVVGAGDEIIGLTRGLLFAGAKSLLLSLWDVNDSSTAHFMTAFYSRFFNQHDRASAFQGAVQELKQRYPHPYYWAPFVLVGDVSLMAERAGLRRCSGRRATPRASAHSELAPG